jgi:hypothetical protein
MSKIREHHDERSRNGNNLNWNLTSKMKTCKDCSIGKAKEWNIVKVSGHQGSEKRSMCSYWRISVDGKTQLKFSDF